jgi:signal transduction histidine kinase
VTRLLRVLLIEDSASDVGLIVRHLESAGYEVRFHCVQTGAALRAALADAEFDVIIADYHLPQFDAPAALAIVRESGLDIPFLIVSGAIGEERAVAMMKSGAQDYVMKDHMARLAPAVEREVREATGRQRTEAERHRLEEQLRQSQKMDSIGRVAAAVAHDFNNLLMVISGFAQMGLSEPGLPDHVHDALTQIGDAADRAVDLARRLLNFSRSKPADSQEIILNTLVQGFGKMLDPVLGTNIRLDVCLDPKAAAIYADPGQIEQILMNLVVNARDAMPDGGCLTIETAVVPASRRILLRVIDTGMGMPPEVMARIFEPFFTTKAEGRARAWAWRRCMAS